MKPTAIQYEEAHTSQPDPKYRRNFIRQMQDELKQRIEEFPVSDDIRVIIRVESRQ